MKKFLFLFPLVLSAIPTVATSSSTAQGQGVSSWSFNHTCAVGDHVLLNVLTVGETGNPGAAKTVTSVTFTVVSTGAAIALTKFTTDGNAVYRTNEIWQMFGCPSGVTGSITVTLSGTVQASFGIVRAAAISITDADYLTTLSYNGNSHEEDINGTNLSSYSVTTTRANEVIITSAAATSGAPHYTGALGTAEVFNDTPAGTGTNYAVQYLNAGAAGSKTVGWSGAPGTPVTNLSLSIRPWTGFTSVGILTRSIEIPIQIQTGTSIIDANMGDTQLTAGGWARSTLASGSFNGGSVFVNANDGRGAGTTHCPTGPNGYQICVFQLTNYAAGVATWAAGPDMTAYGIIGGLGCPGEPTRDMRSRSPFVFKDKLYLLVGCTDATFLWYHTGILAIPDGIHTCNWATFQTGGNGGANTCDAGNWSSTGDKGSSSAAFQWPSATPTPPLVAMTIVSMGCQDNSTTCAVAPGLDPAYVYFVGKVVARLPKSASDPMDPTQYTYRQGDGSWTNVLATADVFTAPVGGVAGGGITWDRYHGVFIATGGDKHGYATAPLPWGPWTNHPPSSTANYQFESMIDPLLTITAGRVTGVISLNTSTGFVYTLESVDYGPVTPIRVQ